MSRNRRKKKDRPWFKDPSVKRLKPGPPPPNHPRRCQAPNNVGTQCGRWALSGADYCEFHGGRQSLARKRMPDFYSKHAGPKLSKMLKDLDEATSDERIDLSGEVDLARVQAQRAVRIYEKVVLEKALDETYAEDPEKLESLKAQASANLKASLDHVKDMVSTTAKIEALKADKISVHNVKWIAERISRIIYEEVEPVDKETARRVMKRINDLRLLDDNQAHPNVVISID